MKKISKVVLCLASVALLGSCAKSISKEEAVEISKNYSVEKLSYSKAHSKITTKIDGSGKNYDRIKNMLKEKFGLEEGTEEVDISSVSGLMLTPVAVASLNAECADIQWKADGNALSYSYEVKLSLSVATFKYDVTTKADASFNAEGLGTSSKQDIKVVLTVGEDKEEVHAVCTTSISYSK